MGHNDYEGLYVGLIDHDSELYKRWRSVSETVDQYWSNVPGEDVFSRCRTWKTGSTQKTQKEDFGLRETQLYDTREVCYV